MSKYFLAFVALFFLSPSLPADQDAEQGLRIMTEVDLRDTGWVDYTVDLTMILSNAREETSERQIRMKSKETEGDGKKSVTRCTEGAGQKKYMR